MIAPSERVLATRFEPPTSQRDRDRLRAVFFWSEVVALATVSLRPRLTISADVGSRATGGGEAPKNIERPVIIESMALAIERGWLTMHESGTYVRFTPVGADLFA